MRGSGRWGQIELRIVEVRSTEGEENRKRGRRKKCEFVRTEGGGNLEKGWKEEGGKEEREEGGRRNMGWREDEGRKKARDREKDKCWTTRRWKWARNLA